MDVIFAAFWEHRKKAKLQSNKSVVKVILKQILHTTYQAQDLSHMVYLLSARYSALHSCQSRWLRKINGFFTVDHQARILLYNWSFKKVNGSLFV